MRGLLCYYSGTGNTQLACRYLAQKVKHAEWTLCDIVREKLPDVNTFDIVGFACFTDFWGVPQRMLQCLESLAGGKNRPAFTLTTYGMIGGFALRDLSRLARKRGFHVINGFAFHTPENYPPMICGGMAMENAPKPGELKRFSRFLSTLDTQLSDLAAGRMVPLRKPGEHFLTALFSAYPRTKARQEMGGKFVDEKLCTQCRTCEKGCPYHAIRLSPFPKFDPAGCYGCWACFHHCPKKAIYTQQFRGRGHYPKPNARLINKLAE